MANTDFPLEVEATQQPGSNKRWTDEEAQERAAESPAAGREIIDGFSVGATMTYIQALDQYAANLKEQSKLKSKVSGADTVSPTHVEAAIQFLGAGSSATSAKHMGSIGGVLLGAGIGTLLEMVRDNEFGLIPVAVTFVLSIAGAAFLAYNIAKD